MNPTIEERLAKLESRIAAVEEAIAKAQAMFGRFIQSGMGKRISAMLKDTDR